MTALSPTQANGVSGVSHARVYVSFDVDHDRELYERLSGKQEDRGYASRVNRSSSPRTTTGPSERAAESAKQTK